MWKEIGLLGVGILITSTASFITWVFGFALYLTFLFAVGIFCILLSGYLFYLDWKKKKNVNKSKLKKNKKKEPQPEPIMKFRKLILKASRMYPSHDETDINIKRSQFIEIYNSYLLWANIKFDKPNLDARVRSISHNLHIYRTSKHFSNLEENLPNIRIDSLEWATEEFKEGIEEIGTLMEHSYSLIIALSYPHKIESRIKKMHHDYNKILDEYEKIKTDLEPFYGKKFPEYNFGRLDEYDYSREVLDSPDYIVS